ncbi:AAA family ATPase [Flavihumibacter sp. ZG627]|uniref:AAA family ATPase n=1 Tax=Flavihumibacter sp. ZG627 TaxID=1463156 RepID=UPI00057F563B|nr:AAA family ATPase [Flavihumibacter sp. ZG627]KIC89139.1 hypothetical protein HY58_18470 [Flavihumibacter sp. ZG627]
MQTEFIKIIEGGLKGDPNKVLSYTKLLIQNLRKGGDDRTADRLERLISSQSSSTVFQDQLISAPVDQESRLTMANVIIPSESSFQVVFSDGMMNMVENFIGLVKNKSLLTQAGIETSTSLLLYGPPGCGKTTMAHYIAKQLNLPLVVTRFDSLISSLLGNTAKNIRRVFDFASSRPCILFLDEFDAIGKARDDQYELGELKRVINSLLQNMDEFLAAGNILIAATNHHELLDKAIWRRFTYVVDMGKPDEAIIGSLVKSIFRNIDNQIVKDQKKFDALVRSMQGLSFAEIRTVCNNAASKYIIQRKKELTYEDLLTELYLFENNNKYDDSSLVKYLESHGVSRAAISNHMGISYRQIVNLSEKSSQS